MAGVSLVKLPLYECHWTILMMSTLVQVMAWCRQATSHYLSQCWPRSLSPYGVTRPRCVKLLCYVSISKNTFSHFFRIIHLKRFATTISSNPVPDTVPCGFPGCWGGPVLPSMLQGHITLKQLVAPRAGCSHAAQETSVSCLPTALHSKV